MKYNRNNQKPISDDIYTPEVIKDAIDKYCNLCDRYITINEAEKKDFVYTRTRRGHNIFAHKHCLRGKR